ncbi:hypothetical protein [Bacillus sp. AK128]
MNNKKQFNWDEFQYFFSNFNPFQYGSDLPEQGIDSHISELMRGKLFINTEEKNGEFLVDIMLPHDIDLENIEHKVITKSRPSGKKYKSLSIKIPRIKE